MKNLANPTVGDILDRLSILSMKEASDEKLREATMLLEKLNKIAAVSVDGGGERRFLVTAEMLCGMLYLAALNGRIWEMHERPAGVPLEDAMRLNKLRCTAVEKLG